MMMLYTSTPCIDLAATTPDTSLVGAAPVCRTDTQGSSRQSSIASIHSVSSV
jgi:hypothetical protein